MKQIGKAIAYIFNLCFIIFFMLLLNIRGKKRMRERGGRERERGRRARNTAIICETEIKVKSQIVSAHYAPKHVICLIFYN